MTAPCITAIIPVPSIIARRAWECALDLRGAPATSPAAARWLHDVARQGPEAITWQDAGALFRLHRHHRPVRA